jgi:hypothetical protein
MGLITEAGRAAMAKAIKEQSLFLALGRGSSSWGNGAPPLEDIESVGLLDEIGRRALTRSLYVVPDENGDIEVPVSTAQNQDGSWSVETERFSASETPTRHLYVEFAMDYTDAVDETVRELGLYVGSVLKPNLPEGQMFFQDSDFSSEGLLFEIEHKRPYIREVNRRTTFAWVVTL